MRFRTLKCLAAGVAAIAAVATADAQPVLADIAPIVTSGLDSQPLGIASTGDRTDRLVVIHRFGQARVVKAGTLLTTPYFAMPAAGVQCRETPSSPLANTGFATGGSEQGLLGLAFHPSFASNGRVFVSYSGANGDSILARYTVANPSADVMSAEDLATCVVVLRVDQDFENHNGGNILFGPDGYLYFGLGDGGSGGDPCNRGQTLDPANLDAGGSCAPDASFPGNPDSRALLGKMLRLDVDQTTAAGSTGLCAADGDGSADYAIPASNPYVGASPNCDETYAYGLRNPWRWSFDRATGDMIIGDVGQDRWEEVSLTSAALLPGRNFDWKVCEGRHLRDSCTTLCDAVAASEVIVEYENNGAGCLSGTRQGCSITGGFRYRGPDPRFQGIYFFGDACNSGLRHSSETSPDTWQASTDATTVTGLSGTILAFGEDEDGALYFVSGSRLNRIGQASPTNVIFANGFE